ncbi:hypothetical protein [Streptomyces sp. AK08-02]|uniref:hypothetical protein n=1 Tax=Streptomyces sp. AK08-02 TaxID=3028654 RepID=UPI0029A8C65E|nr:hypothetical protein [Streptomyces sp. AK08-02]MDX3751095.1 hypothetical protein [Streptomyces sp. AK08-02]
MDDFDTIRARSGEAGLPYWADPSHRRPHEINANDGGRGAYFEEPKGHSPGDPYAAVREGERGRGQG